MQTRREDAEIVVREPGRVALSIALKDGFRAGRHEDNDLVLDDRLVSRHHLGFAATISGFRVEDLGSSHGVFVNGERTVARALADGDRIEVGSVVIVYRDQPKIPEEIHTDATPIPQLEPADAGAGGDRRWVIFRELARALDTLEDAEEVLGRILAGAVQALGAERGLVGFAREARRTPVRISRTRAGAGDEELVVCRKMLDAMLVRGERVVIRGRRRSAIGAPIQRGQRIFGFIWIEDTSREAPFTTEELQLLGVVAETGAAFLEASERAERSANVVAAANDANAVPELIGTSTPVRRLREQIDQAAGAHGVHVLLRGEAGTGKELVARMIHAVSPRANGPFVALECAGIPEAKIETELFGVVNDAAGDKRGKFVLAHCGTLFLDEVGQLSPSAQAKLLHAMEEGEVQPVGAEHPIRVDLRIIAATHRDLAAEIAAGRFREDLYHRLCVLEIDVPPLRDRQDDILRLAEHFLARSAAAVGRRFSGFDLQAISSLRAHHWPGNVRELRNAIERAAMSATGPWIRAADLGTRLSSPSSEGAPGGRAGDDTPKAINMAEAFASLETTERRLVEEAMTKTRGNISEAARMLGITRIMMKRRLERFGLRS